VENIWNERFAGTKDESRSSPGVTERKATAKAKGCAVERSLFCSLWFYFSELDGINCSYFSASFRFVLCWLRGFARLRGLTGFLGQRVRDRYRDPSPTAQDDGGLRLRMTAV
jgi:hypothetical protein